MTKLNILHVISYIGQDQGGPVESLRLIVKAQVSSGHRIQIVHTHTSSNGMTIDFENQTKIIELKSFTNYRVSFNSINKIINKDYIPDIIHVHGLWSYNLIVVQKISKKFNIPFFISPCGMLNPKALKISKYRKKIISFLFEESIIKSANCLIAKSQLEFKDISNLYPNNRIEIIGNPIDLYHLDDNYNINSDSKNKELIFIGRIHHVKGLVQLLRAWNKIAPKFQDWELTLIGPDESNYLSQLQKIINFKQNRVKYLGAIYNREKWQRLYNADLFIMPSNFENFGTSILEALSSGLPVIISNQTPWTEIQKHKMGWIVENNNESIEKTLEIALSYSKKELKIMGEKGKKFAKYFDYKFIGDTLIRLYYKLQYD